MKSICLFALIALCVPGITQAQAVFGDGSDGAFNPVGTTSLVTPNTTLSSSATAGTTTLNVNSTSGFVAGQEVLIIQFQGASNAGRYEFRKIGSVGASSITLTAPTVNPFDSAGDARVIKVWQFTTINVPGSATVSSTAPVLAMRAQTSMVLNGLLDMTARGFPGGGIVGGGHGQSGVSYGGGSSGSTSANFGGGGGGEGGGGVGSSGGGGGSYGSAGFASSAAGAASAADAGGVYGADFPSRMYLGSGGGGGGAVVLGPMTEGGDGGGIIYVASPTLTIGGGGGMRTEGQRGEDGVDSALAGKSGGGGGAGGSIFVTISSTSTIVNGGALSALRGLRGLVPSLPTFAVANGGDGGNGRIHINGTISGGAVVPSATFGPGEPPLAASVEGAWSSYE
jgi:hypothetical protein